MIVPLVGCQFANLELVFSAAVHRKSVHGLQCAEIVPELSMYLPAGFVRFWPEPASSDLPSQQ